MATAAEIEIAIRAKNSADAEIKKLRASLDSVGTTAHATSSKLASIGNALKPLAFGAAAAGVAGFGAALVGTVKVAADFQQSLANVGAATGATKDQMAEMRAEALKIGRDTSKSASEAVSAMGELTKSGVSVTDVVGGVARTVVQLSEATGSSVANMATLMSDAMNVFGISAADSTAAANTLGKAAGASSITIEDMALSLSAGGLVARSAGLGISEFATAIGIMGNQGLKSSDAGTSLKAMIAGLTPTSKEAKKAFNALGISIFDASGAFLPFPEILANLSQGFAGLTEKQRAETAELIFGSDGVRAFNALIPDTSKGLKDATQQWDEFGNAMAGAPSIAEQSATRLATFSGAIEMLKGTLETVAIQIGTVFLPILTAVVSFLAERIPGAFAALGGILSSLAPVFEGVKGFVSGLIGSFLTILPTIQTVAATVGGVLAAAFGALMGVLAPVIEAVRGIAEPFLAGVGAVLGFAGAWSVVAAVIGPLIALLGGALLAALGAILSPLGLIAIAVGLAFVAWEKNFLGIREITATVVGEVGGLIAGVVGFFRDHWDQITGIAQTAWAGVTGVVAAALSGINDLVSAIVGWLRDHWDQITTIAQTSWGKVKEIVAAALSGIGDLAADVTADVETSWGRLSTIASSAWEGVRTSTAGVLDQIIDRAGDLVSFIADNWSEIQGIAEAAWSGIAGIVNEVVSSIKELIGGITTYFDENGQLMKDAASNIWALIQAVFEAGVEMVKGILTVAIGALVVIWRTFGDDIVEIGRIAWDTIKGVVEGAMNVLGGIIKTVLAVIAGDWGAAWEGLQQVAKGAFQILQSIAEGALGVLTTVIEALIEAALHPLKEALEAAGNAISTVFKPQIDAAKDAANLAKDAVNFLSSGIDAVAGAAGRVLTPLQWLIDKLGAVGKAKGVLDFVLPGSLPPLAEGIKATGDEAGKAAPVLGTFAKTLDDTGKAAAIVTSAVSDFAARLTDSAGLVPAIRAANDELRAAQVAARELGKEYAALKDKSTAYAATVKAQVDAAKEAVTQAQERVRLLKEEKDDLDNAGGAVAGYRQALDSLTEGGRALVDIMAKAEAAFENIGDPAKAGALAQTVQKMIDDAVKAGVPGAAAAGAQIHEAWLAAFATLDPADIDRASQMSVDLIRATADQRAIAEAEKVAKDLAKKAVGAITAENLSGAIAEALFGDALVQQIGTKGQAVIAALQQWGEDATESNKQSAGKAVAAWIAQFDKLPAEVRARVPEVEAAIAAWSIEPTDANLSLVRDRMREANVDLDAFTKQHEQLVSLIPKQWALLPPHVQAAWSQIRDIISGGRVFTEEETGYIQAALGMIPAELEKWPPAAQAAMAALLAQLDAGTIGADQFALAVKSLTESLTGIGPAATMAATAMAQLMVASGGISQAEATVTGGAGYIGAVSGQGATRERIGGVIKTTFADGTTTYTALPGLLGTPGASGLAGSLEEAQRLAGLGGIEKPQDIIAAAMMRDAAESIQATAAINSGAALSLFEAGGLYSGAAKDFGGSTGTFDTAVNQFGEVVQVQTAEAREFLRPPEPAVERLQHGTRGARRGWAWVGEAGPELMRMAGGETVLPAGISRLIAGLSGGARFPGYQGGASVMHGAGGTLGYGSFGAQVGLKGYPGYAVNASPTAGIVVNVNISGPVYGTSSDEFAREVEAAIVTRQRAGGLRGFSV